VKSSIFFGNDATATNFPPAQATGDIDESLFINAANGDVFQDPGLGAAALSKTAPDFKPSGTSLALTMTGATPPSDGFFDTSATFIGAVGATDWTAGWTAYPQN
jgi:hypothetical protein